MSAGAAMRLTDSTANLNQRSISSSASFDAGERANSPNAAASSARPARGSNTVPSSVSCT
jgi:hypothetical protein